MTDAVDLAAHDGLVRALDLAADTTEAEAAQRRELPLGRAARGLDLGDRETGHRLRLLLRAGGGRNGLGLAGVDRCVVSRLRGLWLAWREAEDLGDGRPAQRLERGDRGLDEVDRVLAAERLREDVVDARELEDRTHASTCDDAGTGRGRLEQHARGGVDAERLVSDRRAVHRHLDHRAACALYALLDRDRNLVRLAVADADLRLLVAHDDERREREATAALDDLGDAVDLDHALLQIAVAPSAPVISVVVTCHEVPVAE